MGKAITHKLEYREKGEKKTIDIELNFVSRGIIRDYENLRDKQDSLKEKVAKLNKFEYLIADYKEEKPEGYKIELKKLYDNASALSDEILNFDQDTFITEQFKLLKMILTDNGIENKMLFDDNFWEYSVEVNAMIDFIVAAVYKDFDLKKKPSLVA